MLIASTLKNGLHDLTIICSKEKESKSDLEVNKKSLDGFDMMLSVLQYLVPRLRNNSLSYDPTTLINGLKANKSGSYKAFYSKAQETSEILCCLKEDYGPHKLVTRCLE